MLKHFLLGVGDVLFPPRCMACGVVLGDGRVSFCVRCFSQIRFIGSPLCVQCGMPYDGQDSDHLCGQCLAFPPPFAVARAVGRYDQVMMDLIHRFKYGSKIAIGEWLGRLMAETVYPGFQVREYSLLMPVPLHPRRLRQRGFNQALILAKEISRSLSMDLDFRSLRRIAGTVPQVGLNRDMRERNIAGAFSVAERQRVKGQRIVLVDDVYTTGSTVRECVRMLLEAEARDVAVLTAARAC